MSCDAIKELTVPYLELDLDSSRVREVTDHVERCEACRREMEDVRQVLVRLKGQTVRDPGERFWEEFPHMVRRELQAQSQGTSSLSRHHSGSLYQRWQPRLYLALAASVLVLIGAWALLGMPFKSAQDLSSQGQTVVKNTIASPPRLAFPQLELGELSDADLDSPWGEEDPDALIVDLAGRLDRPTLERLLRDI